MKRKILFIALLLFAFIALLLFAFMTDNRALAQDDWFTATTPSGQELRFYTLSNSTDVSVGGDKKISGDLVIPSSVTYNNKTYTVTTIEEYAFYHCTGLTSVTIPNSVTSIGRHAFYGCTGLTSLTFNAAVPPSIQSNSFSNVSCDATVKVPCGSLNAYKSTTNYDYFYKITCLGDNEDNRK